MGAIAAVANAVGVRDGVSMPLVDSLGRAQPFATSLAAVVLYSAFTMGATARK